MRLRYYNSKTNNIYKFYIQYLQIRNNIYVCVCVCPIFFFHTENCDHLDLLTWSKAMFQYKLCMNNENENFAQYIIGIFMYNNLSIREVFYFLHWKKIVNILSFYTISSTLFLVKLLTRFNLTKDNSFIPKIICWHKY